MTRLAVCIGYKVCYRVAIALSHHSPAWYRYKDDSFTQSMLSSNPPVILQWTMVDDLRWWAISLVSTQPTNPRSACFFHFQTLSSVYSQSNNKQTNRQTSKQSDKPSMLDHKTTKALSPLEQWPMVAWTNKEAWVTFLVSNKGDQWAARAVMRNTLFFFLFLNRGLSRHDRQPLDKVLSISDPIITFAALIVFFSFLLGLPMIFTIPGFSLRIRCFLSSLGAIAATMPFVTRRFRRRMGESMCLCTC